MGHYANECHTSAHKIPNYRNPTYYDRDSKPEFKQEYTGNIKVCKYCKKPNHDISECRKRIYNEQKKKQGNNSNEAQGNRSVDEYKSNNNIRVIAGDSEIVSPRRNHNLGKMENKETLCPLNGPTISCTSTHFTKHQQTFLIDTGANKNLIKISKLQGKLIINE